jgi:hypothetical protein
MGKRGREIGRKKEGERYFDFGIPEEGGKE